MQFHTFLDFSLCWFPSHPLTASLPFSQHNGFFAPSTLPIFFFVVFLGFLIAHECDHTFGFLLILELLLWEIVLYPYIIIIFTRTMASFHLHHCWLLYFEVFYNYSSLMTATTCWDGWFHWKLLCWAIKLLLCIMIVFLWSQWRHFTITIVDCYILRFLCNSSL